MPIAGLYGPEDLGRPAPGHPALTTRATYAENQAEALPRPSLECWETSSMCLNASSESQSNRSQPSAP